MGVGSPGRSQGEVHGEGKWRGWLLQTHKRPSEMKTVLRKDDSWLSDGFITYPL